jgi:hypothetical protein
MQGYSNLFRRLIDAFFTDRNLKPKWGPADRNYILGNFVGNCDSRIGVTPIKIGAHRRVLLEN